MAGNQFICELCRWTIWSHHNNSTWWPCQAHPLDCICAQATWLGSCPGPEDNHHHKFEVSLHCVTFGSTLTGCQQDTADLLRWELCDSLASNTSSRGTSNGMGSQGRESKVWHLSCCYLRWLSQDQQILQSPQSQASLYSVTWYITFVHSYSC